MHSLMYNTRTGRLLMGGMQNKLLEFDLTSVKELKQVDVEAKVTDGNTEIDSNNRGTCAILRKYCINVSFLSFRGLLWLIPRIFSLFKRCY